MIKSFLTKYVSKNGEEYAGQKILANNFREAEEKIKIHNKLSKFKLEIVGEFLYELS